MDCPPYNLNSRKVKEDSSTREKDFASKSKLYFLILSLNKHPQKGPYAVSSDHYTCTTKSTQEATLIVITGSHRTLRNIILFNMQIEGLLL